MPCVLKQKLANLGHDTMTAEEEHLGGAPDNEIWAACQQEERFLITQDLDFSNINRFKPGTHPGILVLRLQHPGRLSLTNRVETLFRQEYDPSWKGSFLVSTEHKLRIRKK